MRSPVHYQNCSFWEEFRTPNTDYSGLGSYKTWKMARDVPCLCLWISLAPRAPCFNVFTLTSLSFSLSQSLFPFLFSLHFTSFPFLPFSFFPSFFLSFWGLRYFQLDTLWYSRETSSLQKVLKILHTQTAGHPRDTSQSPRSAWSWGTGTPIISHRENSQFSGTGHTRPSPVKIL